jgi:hypothetical protein
MKKIFAVLAALSVVLSLSLTSCASTDSLANDGRVKNVKPKKFVQEDFDRAIASGNLEDALSMTVGRKYAKNDIIIQKMDIALMRHFTRDYAGSAAYLNSANEDIKNAVTQSIAKGAIAAIGNENAKEYAGAIYESHFLNVFNALNYYNRGDLESAVALMKDLAQKRVMYDSVALAVASESDEDIEKEAAADVAESESGKKGKKNNKKKAAKSSKSPFEVDMEAVNRRAPRKPAKEDIFTDSALERYAALNFYKMQLLDHTTPIDVRGIAEQEIEQQGKLFAVRAPSYNVTEDITIPSGQGRVNILAFSGLAGRRQEHATYFPGDFIDGMPFLPPVTIAGVTIPPFRLKFVYPEFIRKPKKIQRIVACVGSEEIELALLEDFDNDIWMDVNAKAYKAFKRSMFRSILKKSAAVTAGAASIAAAGRMSDALKTIAEISASVAIDAVDLAETADIRQVMALPSCASCGGVNLASGVYPVTVRYFDANGALVAEDSLGNVTVRENTLTLLESLCIR